MASAGWTSQALGRLDLSPEDLERTLLRLTGLPDDPEGQDIVRLHLCSLDVSLDVGSPELLAPHLSWEANRLAQVSTEPGRPSVTAAVRSVLAEHLDEVTRRVVVRHLEAAEEIWRSRRSSLRERRASSGVAALSGDVGDYLAHAVAGRHEPAIEHVLDLADAGWSVPQLLLGVIAPAQHELGRLWERGAITVAQEHMATAVTHLAMYALYPRLVARERLGLSLVAATPPGDRHSVGLRLVTDLLHHRGWDVHYVGTSCPVPDIIGTTVVVDASLLLLGASMTCHLPALREAVTQVRADRRCEGVTVLAGGRPFRAASGLREWVGADHVASHATDAVAIVDRLLEPEAPSRG